MLCPVGTFNLHADWGEDKIDRTSDATSWVRLTSPQTHHTTLRWNTTSWISVSSTNMLNKVDWWCFIFRRIQSAYVWTLFQIILFTSVHIYLSLTRGSTDWHQLSDMKYGPLDLSNQHSTFPDTVPRNHKYRVGSYDWKKEDPIIKIKGMLRAYVRTWTDSMDVI